MNTGPGREMSLLLAGTISLLLCGMVVGSILKRRTSSETAQKVSGLLGSRIRGYWLMGIIFVVAAFLTRGAGTVAMFFLLSFLALREYITLTPTRHGDHATLFWVFFVATPLQYMFVGIQWYGMFSIFIPVYAFLFIPFRNSLAGDPERFLERTAKVQWGLMVFVYCLSHAPAILMLTIPEQEGRNANLLFFLFFVSQGSDLVRQITGIILGRRPVSPAISADETREGLAAGLAASGIMGLALGWCTPFGLWQSAVMGMVVCLMSMAGRLTMSAIRNDRGITGLGWKTGPGFITRIESTCFAAPVFFHLTRFFYAP